MNLTVRVSENFLTDAGTIIDNGDSLVIVPSEKPMFEQLREWLLRLPAPNIGINHWALGIGATALCIRWGTYLSVLMDETKPVDQRAKDGLVSMISDQEMKRINIEASSNLTRLLEIMYDDEYEALDLVRRAYEALPMPQKRVERDWQVYKTTVGTMMAVHLAGRSDFPDQSEIAIANPYRALANTIISLAYRNGPIEDIHAGSGYAYRLTQRRFTSKQIRTVLRFSAERLSGIMGALPFWDENIPNVAAWPQRLAALPFVMLYPFDWSMVEDSSQVTLKKEWINERG